MAGGISLIQEMIDDSDEGVFEQSDSQPACPADYEGFPIYMRVQKYAMTANIYVRSSFSEEDGSLQLVGRMVQDWLRTATPDSIEENIPKLMKTIQDLAENSTVRQDWLEQIPNIASQAVQCAHKAPILNSVTVDYLLPIVVRNLGTSENTVNKAAQQALLQLMQQKLISLPQVEIQVCPSVLALSQDMENVADVNPSIVTLMSKMVRYMGADVSERVFLRRFTELCASQLFYVRRACASHFGEFAISVRKETFEKTLLPCYLELCKDNVTGVRGSCAQVAMYVSCMSSPKVRKTVLTQVFVKLLQDDCRWVRLSAFNTLGAFISTFADPSFIKLEYNDKGDLMFATGDGNEYRIASIQHIENILETFLSPSSVRCFTPLCNEDQLLLWGDCFEGIPSDQTDCGQIECKTESADEDVNSSGTSTISLDEEENKENVDFNRCNQINDNKECDILDNKLNEDMTNLRIVENESDNSTCSTDFNSNKCSLDNVKSEKVTVDNSVQDVSQGVENNNIKKDEEDNLHLYNSYNYWYIRPELPLEGPVTASVNETNSSNETSKMETEKGDADNSEAELKCQDVDIEEKDIEGEKYEEEGEEEEGEEEDREEEAEVEEEEDPNAQQIVPQLLIDHYISMTDPNLIHSFDHEMTYQCAYSFPAVALTLGSDNWDLLKNTVQLLASDKQYKVRRTVAGYLHELALILGPEIASNNLTPLFDDFIKDLDEVRIEILKNLADFLRLISPSKRSACLPRLSEFLKIDHQWNWRFRQELAKQLYIAVPLFRPNEVIKHLASIAQELLCDNVCAVRQSALLLVTQIVKHTSGEPGISSRLLVKLAEVFAHSMKWKKRQTFALLCSELLYANALKPESFGTDVMPHLLDLSWDPVANVRLVVARAITRHIITHEYFSDPNNQYSECLDTVLRRLQADKDRDVRQATERDVC